MRNSSHALFTVGLVILLGGCGQQPSGDTQPSQGITASPASAKPNAPAPDNKMPKVITAPPETVIPRSVLESTYGWVGGQFTLSRVSENATMMRERRGDTAVFTLHDMALGRLGVDGECFWDSTGFHLLTGKAYLVCGGTNDASASR